jgi:hypothetical protein
MAISGPFGTPQPADPTDTPASQQGPAALWLRQWSLQIQKSGAAPGTMTPTLDLSELHMQFAVQRGIYLTPSSLELTVYNVGPNQMQQLSKEFTTVHLQAGYQPPSLQYGDIFTGLSWQYQRGRVNASDSFVKIYANSYDSVVNAAVINQNLPPGHTFQDVFNQATALAGVTLGYVSPAVIMNLPMSRGRTMAGMYRDIVRDAARTLGATAFHDDTGQLIVLAPGEALPGDAFKLNSTSGLIGVPTQTRGGHIKAVSLLNPRLKPGGAIHINQADIIRLTGYGLGANPSPLEQAQNAPGQSGATPGQQFQIDTTAATTTDGYYKIINLVHRGDTRGNPWYTEMDCVSLNPDLQGRPPPVQLTR